MTLKDQVAVVTGAASGIGYATAQAMIEEGAQVVLTDVAVEKGQAAAEELRSMGRCEFVALDVADRVSVRTAAKDILEQFGKVDIVTNVAGWGKIQFFMENSDEFIDRVIAINLLGPVNVVREFLPVMAEAKYGRIINVASDAGRVGSLGETAYAAAKGGIIAFTKSLARESARYNVNVNCVCPGPTDTPLLEAVPEKHRESFKRAIPMKRFGQPSEVADAVIFFASPRSEYVTGQILSVSGGLTMVD